MGRHVSTHDGRGKMWGGGKSREQLADRAATAAAFIFPKKSTRVPHGHGCMEVTVYYHGSGITVAML